MGDTEDTTATDTSDTSDTSDTDTSDDTTEDESDTSQNNGDEDDAGASDDGENKGKGDSQETDTADDDTEDEADDGEVPELRKPKAGDSNAKWAAWRAQEKAKKEAKTGKGDDSSDDGEDTDDDDGLSPEDKAKFDKRIEKHLAPFKQNAAEQEVDTEIASFLAENPDFKPFVAKAKRYALHPNREGVPIKAIFYEVAGDKLLAIGAKRAKQADQKANQKRIAGGRPAGDKGSQSYKDMPLTDFGKELEAAKLRR